METYRAICVGGPLDGRIIDCSSPVLVAPVFKEPPVCCIPVPPTPDMVDIETVQYHYTPRYSLKHRCEILAQWRQQIPAEAQPPQNTSPMFPPQAANGMMQGVEGGVE